MGNNQNKNGEEANDIDEDDETVDELGDIGRNLLSKTICGAAGSTRASANLGNTRASANFRRKSTVNFKMRVADSNLMRANSSDSNLARARRFSKRISIVGPLQILTRDLIKALSTQLPSPFSGKEHWMKTFCLGSHGASLAQLYRRNKISKNMAQLIVFQAADGRVIGGFCPQGFVRSTHLGYYGDGRCCVFSIDSPGVPASVKVWQSKVTQEMRVYAGDEYLAMGGGGGGFTWCVDEDMGTCTCAISPTFGNETPLVPSGFFDVVNVECWGVMGVKSTQRVSFYD